MITRERAQALINALQKDDPEAVANILFDHYIERSRKETNAVISEYYRKAALGAASINPSRSTNAETNTTT